MPGNSLTDFEIEALHNHFNLADGHAYQDLITPYKGIVEDLNLLWDECDRTSIPEIENRYRSTFARLAGSVCMAELPFFKICPTASDSISIVAAVLAERRAVVQLVEPTFDNLALLLRRHQVPILPLSEERLFSAAQMKSIPELLEDERFDALFLVQPNNPTGRCLDAPSFRDIAIYCAENRKSLVVDNSFRFFNRRPFDDYAILSEVGCSFIAFEDTGKVWPTHDLKASLLFCSRDLESLVSTIYNEVFLCTSRFTLALLERFLRRTSELGLDHTIWPQVDERRALLRNALSETRLIVDASSIHSHISVEWLDCRKTGYCDLVLRDVFATHGLSVLPGRQFFWNSSSRYERQFNVRVALMKPVRSFGQSVDILKVVTHADGRILEVTR